VPIVTFDGYERFPAPSVGEEATYMLRIYEHLPHDTASSLWESAKSPMIPGRRPFVRNIILLGKNRSIRTMNSHFGAGTGSIPSPLPSLFGAPPATTNWAS
jgi:hypothetical protein